MITKVTGRLLSLAADSLTLGVGAFEYEVRVPEFTRRQLQDRVGDEVSLHTIDYLEGNPAQGRLTPRLIGFLSEIEREFFELICSVDGVGVKKALRAIVRPVPEVATAIEEQDAKTLSSLPGVGAALAERIIAKLRRKVPKFALMVARQGPREADVERDVIEETFQVLRQLGHSESDARRLLETALKVKKKYADVQALLQAIYQQRQGGEPAAVDGNVGGGGENNDEGGDAPSGGKARASRK
jgi:holliday junction DNA helicase RuvA